VGPTPPRAGRARHRDWLALLEWWRGLREGKKWREVTLWVYFALPLYCLPEGLYQTRAMQVMRSDVERGEEIVQRSRVVSERDGNRVTKVRVKWGFEAKSGAPL
jgi:hypothetical protein